MRLRKPYSALCKARVCFAGKSARTFLQSYAGTIVVKEFDAAFLKGGLHSEKCAGVRLDGALK